MHKYRLTLILSLTSAAAIVVATLIVSRLHGDLAVRNLLKLSEEETFRQAQHIQSMLHREESVFLKRLAGPEGLPRTFRNLIEGMGIVKVNLFDLDGRTVWSTDADSIGLPNDHTLLFQKALQDGVGSAFVPNKALVTLNGAPRRLDVVEIYLPLRASPAGPILGVIELYRDASTNVSLQVRDVKSLVVRTTIATMGGLFLVLHVFTIVADVSIYRSNRRELELVEAQLAERRRAEAALRQAHDGLEQRVQERTAELSHTLTRLHEQISECQRSEAQLQQSRSQLRALSSHLFYAQEAERQRIAREIHDELGQALTALKIDLAWVQRRLPTHEASLRHKIDTMTGLTDTTIYTVRRVASALRPLILDDLGLAAALQWLLKDWQERTGMACALTLHPEDLSLDAARSTTVFRIVQEALTNVARHAHATWVDVSLRAEPQRLCLEVRDNGTGIPDQAVQAPQSLGLLGLRERVWQWGGEVHIQGTRGRGTILRVHLPHTDQAAISKEVSHDQRAHRRRPCHRAPGLEADSGRHARPDRSRRSGYGP